MPTNYQQFSRLLKEEASSVDRQIALAMRALAFRVFQRIVDRSPVDTGFFSSQHRVSVGRASGGPISFPSSGPVAERAFQKASASEQIPPLSAFIGASLVTIYNCVDYGIYLEAGSSRQAPAGIYQITADEFRTLQL